MFLDDEFFEFAGDALRETLNVDPATKREMIQFLIDEGFWDKSMKWESAVARFDACLNPNKSEFFKLSELWALMKRFGRHHLFVAMGEDLGYEIRRRATVERVEELLEKILERLDQRDRSESNLRALVQEIADGNKVDLKEVAGPPRRRRWSRAERAP